MPAEELVAVGVATLHEAAGRRGLCRDLRLLVGGAFAGPALTVMLPAGDNLGIHAALADAHEGAVLCVASGGRGRYGVLGELIALAARERGLAGVVIDDGVRDVDLLGSSPSIAAAAITAEGTVKRRYASLGGPVAIAGVLVEPGDWIVGDTDGVLVVGRDRMGAVLAKARDRAGREDDIRSRLAGGATTVDVLGLAGLIERGSAR